MSVPVGVIAAFVFVVVFWIGKPAAWIALSASRRRSTIAQLQPSILSAALSTSTSVVLRKSRRVGKGEVMEDIGLETINIGVAHVRSI